jgi:WD40 repeat protein
MWDLESDKMLFMLTNHRRGTSTLALSPDGKIIATGGNDTIINLWDAATGQLIKKLAKHTNIVRDLAFSADGKRLTSLGLQTQGEYNAEIKVWDIEKQQIDEEFSLSYVDINNAALSTYGNALLCAGIGNTTPSIKTNVWNLRTRSLKDQRTGSMIYGFSALVAFSPDEEIYVELFNHFGAQYSPGASMVRDLSSGNRLHVVQPMREDRRTPARYLSVAISKSRKSLAIGYLANRVEVQAIP